jgi:hypothetical protein
MPTSIDTAYERVKLLRWIINAARDRAFPDPPPEILTQLEADTELAAPAEVRRGVERVFDELDALIAQISFLVVVHAFERDGRSELSAGLRQALVRGYFDLRTLGGISDIIGPLIPDHRSELKVIIEQRNRIAHGAERSETPAVTVEQAFDILSAVAGVCSSAAEVSRGEPEAPET